MRTGGDRLEGAAQGRTGDAARRIGQGVRREPVAPLQMVVDRRRRRQMVARVARMGQVRVVREKGRMLGRQRQLSVEQQAVIHAGVVGAGEEAQGWPERRPTRSRIETGGIQVGEQVGRRVDGWTDAYVRRGVLSGGVGGTWGVFRRRRSRPESGARRRLRAARLRPRVVVETSS